MSAHNTNETKHKKKEKETILDGVNQMKKFK